MFGGNLPPQNPVHRRERLTFTQVGALLSWKCKETSCTQLYSELRNHTDIHEFMYIRTKRCYVLLQHDFIHCIVILIQHFDLACNVLGNGSRRYIARSHEVET